MLRHLRIAALTVLAVGAGGDSPTPWPAGVAPHDTELGELVVDALELGTLERYEEFLEAWEKGEDSEHIFILQEDIDAGQFTVDDLFVFGDAMFGHEFRKEDGYAAVGEPVPLQRVHAGPRGGLDTFSCLGCHSVGGADGAGAATQNALLHGDGETLPSTLERNPPHTLGLGFVQALAREMTRELQYLRDAAVDDAVASGSAVTVALVSKEVDFGVLVARPDGSVDHSGLDGLDRDLVVKPFGWKGKFPDLRRTIEDAARVHFGIQSHVLATAWDDAPDPNLGPGPDWWDPDNDGIQRELEEGTLTAGSVYLSMLEVPVMLPPFSDDLRDRWANGDALFDQVGCNDCHRRRLILLSTRWMEYPDTTEGPPVEVALSADGEFPKATSEVWLFSDLKRHAMGPELSDPHPNNGTGLAQDVWLTRPLWGLADTAPYLHDGSATTIPEAIERHGGEAEASRDAFVALTPEEQADLHIFLLSLTRTPKVRVAL